MIFVFIVEKWIRIRIVSVALLVIPVLAVQIIVSKRTIVFLMVLVMKKIPEHKRKVFFMNYSPCGFLIRIYMQYIIKPIKAINFVGNKPMKSSMIRKIIPRLISIIFAVLLLIGSPLLAYASSFSDSFNSYRQRVHQVNNYMDAWLEVGSTWLRTRFPHTWATSIDDSKLYALSQKRIAELKKIGNFNYVSDDEYLANLWMYDEATDTITITPEGQNICYNAVYNGDYINNQYNDELSDDYRMGYAYDIDNFADPVGESADYVSALKVICDYANRNDYRVKIGDYRTIVSVYKAPLTFVFASTGTYRTSYVYAYYLDDNLQKQSYDRLTYEYNSLSKRFELKQTDTIVPNASIQFRLLNEPDLDMFIGDNSSPSNFWFSNSLLDNSYKGYRIYDALTDIGTGNVPWQSYYSVGDTINNFSEIYNFITNHNEEYNTYITNYYDDHDDMPSLPDIIVYIRTIVPEPTPNPKPTPTPSPTPDNGSSNQNTTGVTVTQNANPVINVINNIKISLLDLFDMDDDTDPTVSPTPSPDPSDPNITPTPSPDPGTGTGSDDNTGDKDKKSVWKRIGDLLGSVFSGVGDLILGILEKLVDLIVGDNGILTAIQGIIDSLITGIPNIIGSLIEYFLPFLPEELIALVSLTVVLAILLAVIRIIRGK